MDPAAKTELRSLCVDEAAFQRALEIFATDYPGCGLCKQRFRMTFDNAPVGIVISDRNHRIVSANAALGHLVDRDREALEGTPLKDLVREDCRADVVDLAEEAWRGRTTAARFSTRLTGPGEDVWARISMDPLLDDEGRALLLMTMVEDLSGLRLAEQRVKEQDRRLAQAEKMAALGTLISGVAHEINNPNNVISMNIGRLRQTWRDVGPILEEYYDEHGDFLVGGLEYGHLRGHLPGLVDDIEGASRRIRDLVRDLLNYGRPQADDDLTAVNLNDLVMAAIAQVDGTEDGRACELGVDLTPMLPVVRGCRRRLEQVLVNLLLNAVQACRGRGGSVRVTTAHAAIDGRIVVVVTDDGPGIPAELHDRICDPFFTTKRNSGGTGLGLWLCATIVDEHGGELHFAPAPTGGTVATVSLPVEVGA